MKLPRRFAEENVGVSWGYPLEKIIRVYWENILGTYIGVYFPSRLDKIIGVGVRPSGKQT